MPQDQYSTFSPEFVNSFIAPDPNADLQAVNGLMSPNQPQVMPPASPNVFKDLALAPVRGALDFGQGIYDLANSADNFIGLDALPDAQINFLGRSETTPGQWIEDITDFTLGFVPVAGAIGKVSKVSKFSSALQAGKLIKSAAPMALKPGIGGAVVGLGKGLGNLTIAGDAVASGIAGALFYKQQDRLSNLIERYPSLENPITAYLAHNENESEAEGRLKNGLEQVLLSPVAAGAVALGVKAIKAGKAALFKGASLEAVDAAVQNVATQEAVDAATAPITATRGMADPAAATTAEAAATAVPKNEFEQLGKISTDPNAPEAQKAAAQAIFNENSTADELIEALGDETKQKLLVDKFNNLDESKKLMASMVNIFKDFLGTSRTVTDNEIVEKGIEVTARMTDLPPNVVIDYLHKTAGKFESNTFAAHAYANYQIAKKFGETWQKTLKSWMDAPTDANALKAFTQANSNYGAVIQSYSHYRSGAGRLLRFVGKIQETGGFANKEISVKNIAKMTEAELANQVSTAAGKAELEKILASVGDGSNPLTMLEASKWNKFWGMHNEYHINMGLLSSVKSMVANLTGPGMKSVLLPVEATLGSIRARVGVSAFGEANAANVTSATTRAALKTYALLAEQVTTMHQAFLNNFKHGTTPFETSLGGETYLKNQYIKVSDDFLKENPVMGKMVNFMGAVTRMPTRIMTATDAMMKHINAHAISKVRLYEEAFTKMPNASKGEVDAYVSKRFMELLDESKALYNKDSISAKFYKEGKELFASGKIESVDDYVTASMDKWQNENGRIIEFAREYAEANNFSQALPDAEIVQGVHARTGKMQMEVFRKSMGKTINDAVNEQPLFKAFLPFTKTPMNILYDVGQRLPIANVPLLGGMQRQYLKDMVSGDPFKVSMAEGRMLMGMASFSTTMALAFNGKITGAGPSNEAERKLWAASGAQPYSFVYENEDGTQTFTSYQRLDPYATYLGLAADVMENIKANPHIDSDTWATVIGGMGVAMSKNVINKTYMQGLEQITTSLTDPDRFLARAARTRISSYVPAFIRHTAGVVDDDPYMREGRTYWDAFKKSFPGSMTDVQRNTLGEPIERKTLSPWLGGVGGKIADYVSPVTVSTKGNDYVMDELVNTRGHFTNPRTQVSGTNGLVDMKSYIGASGQSAYDRYMELSSESKVNSRTLRQNLERLIKSKDYQELSAEPIGDIPSPRVTKIQSLIQKHRDAAMVAVRKEFPDLSNEITRIKGLEGDIKQGKQVSLDDLMPNP